MMESEEQAIFLGCVDFDEHSGPALAQRKIRIIIEFSSVLDNLFCVKVSSRGVGSAEIDIDRRIQSFCQIVLKVLDASLQHFEDTQHVAKNAPVLLLRNGGPVLRKFSGQNIEHSVVSCSAFNGLPIKRSFDGGDLVVGEYVDERLVDVVVGLFQRNYVSSSLVSVDCKGKEPFLYENETRQQTCHTSVTILKRVYLNESMMKEGRSHQNMRIAEFFIENARQTVHLRIDMFGRAVVVYYVASRRVVGQQFESPLEQRSFFMIAELVDDVARVLVASDQTVQFFYVAYAEPACAFYKIEDKIDRVEIVPKILHEQAGGDIRIAMLQV